MNESGLMSEKKEREKRTLLFWGLLAYIVFLFVTVLIRSVISGVTWDEAFTYMWFGMSDMLDPHRLYSLYSKTDCIANNHWLNSILIYLLHLIIREDYNEFVIRLPALTFFALYLIGAVYGYKQRHYSLTVLIFLISNYYLLEFYGLARGYAMANTCVFFACLSFYKWKSSEYRMARHLHWLMIYMSLAVFANTIVLLLYPAFGLLCLYRIIQQKQFKSFLRKSGILFVLFMLFSLIMVKYHMNISSQGKPLYTGGEMGFFDSVVMGYVNMFIHNEKAANVVGVFVAASVVLCPIAEGKNLLKSDFSIMLILFVITNLLLETALHKGYIATRVLLPFYAFIVFSFYELYSNAWTRIAKWGEKTRSKKLISAFGKGKQAISAFVCAMLIASCLMQTNIYSTEDWHGDYKFKLWIEGALLTGEYYPAKFEWNAAEAFYQEKCENIKNVYLEQIGGEK